MIKLFKNIRGETIVETLIALSVLAIGATLVTVMVSNSLRNIHVSKNRVIAVNLAREGMEAMRNIRDTNWLKFSAKRRQCWNHLPQDFETGTCAEICNGSTPIAPGDYIIYKSAGNGINSTCDNSRRWRLDDVNTTNKILYQVDIDSSVNSNNQIGDLEEPIPGFETATIDSNELLTFNKTNDRDIYNHVTPLDALNQSTLLTGKVDGEIITVADGKRESHFSRIITIEYLDNDGSIITEQEWGDLVNASNGDEENLNRMRATSTVSWYEHGRVRTVEIKTHLTDYLGRESLQN